MSLLSCTIVESTQFGLLYPYPCHWWRCRPNCMLDRDSPEHDKHHSERDSWGDAIAKITTLRSRQALHSNGTNGCFDALFCDAFDFSTIAAPKHASEKQFSNQISFTECIAVAPLKYSGFCQNLHATLATRCARSCIARTYPGAGWRVDDVTTHLLSVIADTSTKMSG